MNGFVQRIIPMEVIGEIMDKINVNSFDWIKDIPQWGTFLGTFFVSFLAMFSNRLKSWFCRPKMCYSIDNTRKFCDLTDSEIDDRSDVTDSDKEFLWYLLVENKGRRVAANCQIYCDKIYQEQDSGGRFSLKKEFVSKPFLWATGERKEDVFPGSPSWCKIFILSGLKIQSENATEKANHGENSKALHLYLAIERHVTGMFVSLRNKNRNTFLIPLTIHYENAIKADVIWVRVHWTDGDTMLTQDNLMIEKIEEKKIRELIKEF